MKLEVNYEQELNRHIEQERAAVKLQSKVGELLYEKGITLSHDSFSINIFL